MFHMLDRSGKDFSRFDNLRLLGASPFEHCDNAIKTFVRITFMKIGTSME